MNTGTRVQYRINTQVLEMVYCTTVLFSTGIVVLPRATSKDVNRISRLGAEWCNELLSVWCPMMSLTHTEACTHNSQGLASYDSKRASREAATATGAAACGSRVHDEVKGRPRGVRPDVVCVERGVI